MWKMLVGTAIVFPYFNNKLEPELSVPVAMYIFLGCNNDARLILLLACIAAFLFSSDLYWTFFWCNVFGFPP